MCIHYCMVKSTLTEISLCPHSFTGPTDTFPLSYVPVPHSGCTASHPENCPRMLNLSAGHGTSKKSHAVIGFEGTRTQTVQRHTNTHTCTRTYIHTLICTRYALIYPQREIHTPNATIECYHDNRASPSPGVSGLPVAISTVCQWKLISGLNALHPWANYQLSGSCYIDHDNPPAEGKERRERGSEGEREGRTGSHSKGIKIPHIYARELLLSGSYSIERPRQ